jgi:hypothetical protein
MKIIKTGRTIDHTLNYRTVRFRKEEVGKIPNDIFLSTDQTPPLESLKHTRPVIVNQPETRNGEVHVREVSERFQASAPSPLIGGVVGSLIGGVAGAVVGGVASLLTGNGAFLLGGGSLGVAGGAFLGAQSAANKEVQLIVRERPINSQSMTGIDTRVSRGSLKGRPGYFHTFSAHLQTTHHGNYEIPRVQTVRKT